VKIPANTFRITGGPSDTVLTFTGAEVKFLGVAARRNASAVLAPSDSICVDYECKQHFHEELLNNVAVPTIYSSTKSDESSFEPRDPFYVGQLGQHSNHGFSSSCLNTFWEACGSSTSLLRDIADAHFLRSVTSPKLFIRQELALTISLLMNNRVLIIGCGLENNVSRQGIIRRNWINTLLFKVLIERRIRMKVYAYVHAEVYAGYR